MTVVINGTTGITNVDGSASAPAITGSDTDTGAWFPAANTLAWSTGGTEAMRVSSSQKVGIGQTSPNALLEVNSATAGAEVARFEGNYSASGTVLLTTWRRNGGAIASAMRYNDLTTMEFGTTTNHAQSFMTNGTACGRFDTNGYLLVGYTSSNGAYKLQVNSQIFATNSTIATSDGRYKENVQTLDGALDLVKALRPVQFSWKQHPVHAFDTTTSTVGFIAQEVQQVLADKPYLNSIVKANECVIEPEVKDEEGVVTKEAVKEEFLGIAEGNLIALLTKAIQELNAKVEAQAAEIAALKGA